ncbi:MAG: TolC family protein [Chitinophagaceae bacterium]|nr:TolC family protein [Chitinophagaceae bacterium]
MNTMKRVFWIVVCICIVSGAQAMPVDTTQVQTHSFTAQQAVDYALKNNVQVKNALLGIRLQEETNRQITSAAFPHINSSMTTTYNPNIATQVIPNFISPATYQVLIGEGVKNGNGNPITMPNEFGFIAAQFGTKFSANAAVSLNQILFDGQVFIGLQARDAAMQLAGKSAELTQEIIKANVLKIYYQLVVSRTQVELLDSTISFVNKNLADTRVLYANGFREKLDIDRVAVQLANLQTERNKILSMVSNGYYGLKVLMGMPVQDHLILIDTITSDMIKDGLLVNGTYQYSDRKEFQVADLGRRLGEYNIRRYKLSQVPTLALNSVYAKNAQRNTWNFLSPNQAWFSISNISVGMTLPIFNGFITRSKITQSKIELERTKNEIEGLKRTIDNEVAVAKNNFQSAVSRMDYQKQNLELAEKVYQQIKKKYELGLGSQTEINLAQNEWKAAQTNYTTALSEAIIARIDWLKATGKL